MLCVILSHPILHRCKVEQMESGRDSEVATGLLGTSPFERTDRSRSCPGGAKNLDIYADAQCSSILLPFSPLDCWGDHGDPCQSTFQSGWQSACGHKFSFDLSYISHYYHFIATLDILISEELQHLNSFTWVRQNKGNQQLWEYLLPGKKQQTKKRNWLQYVLGIPSRSHLSSFAQPWMICNYVS